MTIGPNSFVGGANIGGRLSYNNAYFVTSADDTTTTLDADDYPDVVVTGSGVLQWIDLGTATTYENGHLFTVENASDEIVGVKNSDSTVWERVPPRWKVACRLIDNGTSAGTWLVTWFPNVSPEYGFYYKDDFVYGVDDNWSVTNSGSGAVTGATTSTAMSNMMGISYQATGTTTTGYTHMRTGRPTLYGYGPVFFEDRSRPNAKSDVTDEYIIRLGFANQTGVDSVHGAYFENDRSTHGNTNWWICSANTGSNRTKTDSSVDIIATNVGQILRFEVASDASRVDYWIDRVHVGTITTDITSSGTEIGMHIVKSAGTTSRIIYRDYTSFGYFTSSRRG